MLRVARALATKLPTTRAALLAGRTSYLCALKVAEAVNAVSLTPDQLARFEELLWPACEQLTVGQVGYRVDKALARVTPDSLDEQATRATREAYLDVTSRDDITQPGTGAGRIIGRGPALDLVIVSVAIEAWARAVKAAGDPRNLDQLRLAAMVEFSKAYLRGELPGAAAPTSHGSVCTINVGVDLPTFTGLRDGAVEILGHGVFLPASTLDELLPDAGLRRLITHPMTGYLLDATPHVYRPGAGFSRHIGLRDVTSAAPGSQVPAHRTELDHGTPFTSTGLTIRANVTALNKRWHDAKTHGGWTVTQNPDQSRTWTSPTGRTYTTTPHDHRLGP
jgi:hypothetical protein